MTVLPRPASPTLIGRALLAAAAWAERAALRGMARRAAGADPRASRRRAADDAARDAAAAVRSGILPR